MEVHAVVAREGGVIQEVGDRPGFKLVLNGGTGGDATPQGLLRRSQVKIERVEVQPDAGPQVTARREASDMGGWRMCEGRSGAKAPCAAERGEPPVRVRELIAFEPTHSRTQILGLLARGAPCGRSTKCWLRLEKPKRALGIGDLSDGLE